MHSTLLGTLVSSSDPIPSCPFPFEPNPKSDAMRSTFVVAGEWRTGKKKLLVTSV